MISNVALATRYDRQATKASAVLSLSLCTVYAAFRFRLLDNDNYKTAVLVWKCLHDAAPRYLADLCVPANSVHGRQQLRSTASGTLLVPRSRTATGQCSFAINGPRTWNSLPAALRTPDTTLCSFKRHLKAHLFQQ